MTMLNGVDIVVIDIIIAVNYLTVLDIVLLVGVGLHDLAALDVVFLADVGLGGLLVGDVGVGDAWIEGVLSVVDVFDYYVGLVA
jgi:hypothetical protein